MDAIKRWNSTVFVGLTLCLLVLSSVAALSAEPPAFIRVGLDSYGGRIKQISVSASSGFAIVRTGTNEVLANSVGRLTTIQADENQLFLCTDIDKKSLGITITLNSKDSSSYISIDFATPPTRRYRGSLEVSAKAGMLQLVNVVALEDYLLGVLPKEMGESYPIESLKAQAVAARTYGMANLRKHSSRGFDVCDTNDCQVYGGVNAERAKCSQAVADTVGEVLLFKGKPADIQYSADCGGITRNFLDSHPNSKVPYMCAVTEPDDISHLTWQQDFKLSDLEKQFMAIGIEDAIGLKSLCVSKIDSTGRASEITMEGLTSFSIPATQIVKALKLKSTFFQIRMLDKDTIRFDGKGWGHGYGMCQKGACGLALRPHNLTFDQILAHYYPGTDLTGASKPMLPGADVVMVTKNLEEPTVDPAPKKLDKLPTKTEQKQREPFDVRLEIPENL